MIDEREESVMAAQSTYFLYPIQMALSPRKIFSLAKVQPFMGSKNFCISIIYNLSGFPYTPL